MASACSELSHHCDTIVPVIGERGLHLVPNAVHGQRYAVMRWKSYM